MAFCGVRAPPNVCWYWLRLGMWQVQILPVQSLWVVCARTVNASGAPERDSDSDSVTVTKRHHCLFQVPTFVSVFWSLTSSALLSHLGVFRWVGLWGYL